MARRFLPKLIVPNIVALKCLFWPFVASIRQPLPFVNRLPFLVGPFALLSTPPLLSHTVSLRPRGRPCLRVSSEISWIGEEEGGPSRSRFLHLGIRADLHAANATRTRSTSCTRRWNSPPGT